MYLEVYNKILLWRGRGDVQDENVGSASSSTSKTFAYSETLPRDFMPCYGLNVMQTILEYIPSGAGPGVVNDLPSPR